MSADRIPDVIYSGGMRESFRPGGMKENFHPGRMRENFRLGGMSDATN